jgi:hypothetical protein
VDIIQGMIVDASFYNFTIFMSECILPYAAQSIETSLYHFSIFSSDDTYRITNPADECIRVDGNYQRQGEFRREMSRHINHCWCTSFVCAPSGSSVSRVWPTLLNLTDVTQDETQIVCRAYTNTNWTISITAVIESQQLVVNVTYSKTDSSPYYADLYFILGFLCA